MLPPPTQQPAPDRPRWSRHRKGCLIALFLPFLVLFLLLSDLFLSPTGYRDASEQSHATRKKFRESRLPRKETPPEAPVPPTPPSPSETSATAVSDTEARFWGDTRTRLEWRMEILPRHFLVSSFRKLAPGEWTLDPTSNAPTLTPENAQTLAEENARLYLKRLHKQLKGAFLPASRQEERQEKQNEVPCQTDAGLIQKGAWTVQEMDRLEHFLLEKKWDQEEGPDPVFLSIHWSPNLYWGSFSDQTRYWSRTTTEGDFASPIHELIYLLLDRTLESGDTPKAAQLIECYVRLSGEFCFAADPLDHAQVRMLETLERFLFRAASDRRVPEEVLEWTASTLAAWKLTPQEARDLRFANLERWHDLLVASQSSRETDIPPQPSVYHPVPDFLNIALFRIPEKSYAKATGPLLIRTLDRKTAALINQDKAGYQRIILRQMAFSMTPWEIETATTLFSKGGKNSLRCFSNQELGLCSTYLDLLYQDGSDLNEEGESLGRVEAQYRTMNTLKEQMYYLIDFDWLSPDAQFPRKFDTRSSPRQEKTVFEDFGEPLDPYVERFNDSLAMARLVLAAARYHREHGHDPDSVEAMIPRYLDESFRPTPDRFWTLVRQEPQNTVVLKTPREQVIKEVDYWPWSIWCWNSQYSTSLTQTLNLYFQKPENRDHLPGGPEDLTSYTQPGVVPTALAPYFVKTDESRVFALVFPNGLGKTHAGDLYRKAYEENRVDEKTLDQWLWREYKVNIGNPPPIPQLTEDEKLHPDSPFQILHILPAPWNREEFRSPPPSPSGESGK